MTFRLKANLQLQWADRLVITMHNKVISLQSYRYISNALNYEMGPISDIPQLTALVQTFKAAMIESPDKELLHIIDALSPGNPNIDSLNTLIKEDKPIEEMRVNLAFKALLSVIRDWPKKTWHVHFSDHLDGEYILNLNQLKEVPVIPFDFRTSIDHMSDALINKSELYIEAFKYVIRQMHEDGISEGRIRFNPYKYFLGKSHQKRLDKMGKFLKELTCATKLECEELNNSSGRKISIRFIAGLDRRKYTKEGPQQLFDIIDRLSKLKKKIPYLTGIDICGTEILPWEFRKNQGSQLFKVINHASKSGLTIFSHLGDLKHFNKALIANYLVDPNKVIAQLYDNFFSYIRNVPSLSRIGHATVLSDSLHLSKINIEKRDNIIAFIKKNRPDLTFERCYYDDPVTLSDIRKRSPIYFWKHQGLNFAFGNDGVIHMKGHYETGKIGGIYEAVSFSQWILLAMLAAQRNEGWTIDYMQEKVAPIKSW